MKLSKKQLYFIFLATFIFAGRVSPIMAQGPTPFANCRLGVAGTENNLSGYDIGQLNVGTYLDYWSRSSPLAGLPAGVKYIQTVRVHQKKVGSDWYGGGAYVVPAQYSVSLSLTTLA